MSAMPESSDRLDIELDLPASEPTMPLWLANVIAAIAAVVPVPWQAAFAAMEAIVAGLKVTPEWHAAPEAQKAIVRAAKDAKLADMRRARDAATTPQAIPVVREPLPTPTPTPTAPVTELPPAELPLLRGTFRKLTSGRARGSWGAVIETREQSPELTSRRVYVTRADGTSGARKRVGAVVWSGPSNATRGMFAHIVELSDDVTPARGVPVVAPSAPEAPTSDAVDRAAYREATSYARIADLDVEAERNETVVETTLGDIASASAATAERTTVQPATRGNGEPQAHQITDRTHIPTGPSVFDRPRGERGLQVGTSATRAERSDVRSLLAERDFIAGALGAGIDTLQVSWTGGGETTCGKVDDALREIGREIDAPGRKSAEGYAGDAVDALKSREYDTYRMPSKDLPDGIKARWCVGRKLSARDVTAGDAYGHALLIVSLKDDDTLAMDGDTTIANSVRSRYAALTAKQVLKSDTLTAWLGRTLRTRHGAVKRGHVWYVPGGQSEAVQALIDAISPLWGDHETMPVTTGPRLFKSLTRGLSDDVATIERKLADDIETAKQRAQTNAIKAAQQIHNASAEYVEAQGRAAYERGTISATVASRFLGDIGIALARVAGYETALGAEHVKGIRERIAKLVATCEPLADDTSKRAALLELR